MDAGALKVLKGGGDQLGSGGGVPVDEDVERVVALAALAGGGFEWRRGCLRGPPTGEDNLGLGWQEEPEDLHRGVEQAARVAAQVDDQRRHPRVLKLVERLLDLVRRLGGELAERKKSDRRILQQVDVTYRRLAARDAHQLRFAHVGLAWPLDAQRDALAGRPD